MGSHHGDDMDAAEPVEKKLGSPVMCFCATAFRPVFFSMTLLNDCTRCDGWGWVEEHEFTGDEDDCTICGWSRVGHWDYVQDEVV